MFKKTVVGTQMAKIKTTEMMLTFSLIGCSGPRLWDKSISLPVMGEEEEEEEQGGVGDYDVMSMEDFLMENNIRMDASPQVSFLIFC
jgi:hypothetical protein